MTCLLSAEEMRRIERDAIESGSVTALELMERAGRGLLEAILSTWPDLATASPQPGAAILCGPGNNGGDGLVLARLLQGRGWRVEVFLMGDGDALPADARRNLERWRTLGPVAELTGEAIDRVVRSHPALIVDALFGIGLTRPVDLPLDRLRGAGRVVAVDLPSGLCAASGRPLGGGAHVVAADLTVTFHAPKTGHYLSDGPSFCGALRVAPIGLEAQADTDMPRAGGARLLSGPTRPLSKTGGHKYDAGHALILGGGPGRGGAARMAARAALRAGAGLVTLAVPPAALQENAARLDAVMLKPVRDADALAALLSGDERLNALGLGPGLGVGEAARRAVEAVLATGRGAVLDADALTSFADDPDALFAGLHPACILTPHLGEFGRLFPDLAAPLKGTPGSGPAPSRISAAAAAAARAGCTLLLKGPDTVIASPDGAVAVNPGVYDRAAPWLATAGAGDVLTGIITGLLARGFAAPDAAMTAAWLHLEAARLFGPGLIAEDLPDLLPRVMAGS